MTDEGKYCRVCERSFYGSEYQVTNGVCEFCQAEIDKGKTEEQVAREQRRKLETLSPSSMRRRIREAQQRDEG